MRSMKQIEPYQDLKDYSPEQIQVCRNYLHKQKVLLEKTYEPVDEAWNSLPELIESLMVKDSD